MQYPRKHMILVQKVKDRARWGASLILILLRLLFTNGMTHDPQNPSVVEVLNLQRQRSTLVMIFTSAVAMMISNHNNTITL